MEYILYLAFLSPLVGDTTAVYVCLIRMMPKMSSVKENEMFIKLSDLLFYKPFDLQSVYGSDDSMYIVLSHCLIA